MTRLERPEMRELECFVAVAEHLNFSRAARSLGLSQPPLTRHIQALEGEWVAGCWSGTLTRSHSLSRVAGIWRMPVRPWSCWIGQPRVCDSPERG
ncbi:helix-turn-helix domain-containing protein [Verrucomicrobium spinosum]|uniref:helix-turn-helix domain-containing protein n=1 Tax=Verrucomicrobium spinosum TaxID=2736 RepID=UPI0009EA91EC